MSRADSGKRDDFEAELLAAVPFMRAFARSLCHDADQAEDIAQETMMKAWQCRAQFQPGTNLRAWLSTILRNRYYSGQRRMKWRADFDIEVIERTLVAPDDQTQSVELEDVRRGLAMLPAFQREALILVGAGGMSYEEVAQIVGCPIGTVKSRVRRARDELESILFDGRAEPTTPCETPLKAIVDDIDRLRGRAPAAA
jgi:RNA polymerase sigma-70 factor (ECF subfamily)